jgi:hypothetical protein
LSPIGLMLTEFVVGRRRLGALAVYQLIERESIPRGDPGVSIR